METNNKCLPVTKKEHIERSPNTGKDGPSTEVPSTEVPSTEVPSTEVPNTESPSHLPVLPKSGTQSTFNPDLEAPTIPKSGTQSTFNPDIDVPKSDNESSNESSDFSSFLEELFRNF